MENEGFINELIKAKEQEDEAAFMVIVNRVSNFLWSKAHSWSRDKYVARTYDADDLYNIFLQVCHKCIGNFIIDAHLDDHQTYLRFFGNLSRNVRNKGCDIQWEQSRSVRHPPEGRQIFSTSIPASWNGFDESEYEIPSTRRATFDPSILIDIRDKLKGDHLMVFNLSVESKSPADISKDLGVPLDRVHKCMREVRERIKREFSKDAR